MFKTIVVGVDGREGGRDALHLAGRMALVNGGELVAVRVLPFDYYVSRAGAGPYANLAEHDAKHDLERQLEEVGLEARAVVVGDSSPARALHRVAEHERADLIVVGSTHHSRVGRVLAGDDAVGTIHGSSCAVAVAPRGLASLEWTAVGRIGVGFDGREEARQALALAVAIASGCGASLRVRSVVQTPIAAPDAATYDDDYHERARGEAERHVQEALEQVSVEAGGEVLVGDPVELLVELSSQVDLLVVGSRAWGPVRRILLGSSAAKLTREAHCPLLILPRGAATGQPGEADAVEAGSQAA
jgi:nucleotide-binding universal stress UspA family protein